MSVDAPLWWLGSTREDLRELPATARARIGRQLRRVQRGEPPNDWKPMTTVGARCREIRVRTEDGALRSIYVVAGDPRGVYVLAVFTKKTQATPGPVLKLAAARYRAALAHMNGERQ